MIHNASYIYFGIEGDFDPVGFSSMVSLRPDHAVAKHAGNPTHGLPKTSLMRYAELRTTEEIIDIYDLSERVVEILLPHRDAFVEAIRRYDAKAVFQIVLYFPVSGEIPTPAFGFSEKVVAFVAAVGGSIDIDSYRQ